MWYVRFLFNDAVCSSEYTEKNAKMNQNTSHKIFCCLDSFVSFSCRMNDFFSRRAYYSGIIEGLKCSRMLRDVEL
jgi:hypothetical protein